MESDSTQLIIAIGVLIFASSFFSVSETALTSVGKIKVRSLADSNVKGADTLKKLKENPNRFMTAILIGNNFVNILASTLAAVYASKISNDAGVPIATGVMTLLILVFGEITPKTFAAQYSEKISLIVAGPVYTIQLVLTPVIIILNFIVGILMRAARIKPNKDERVITDEVIKTMLNVGHEEGTLEHDEKRMINNIVDFGDDEAKDVMTPRTKIVAAEIGATYNEIIELFREERFSRLPIYDETIDNIVGVLFVKDLVFLDVEKENFNLKGLLREVYFTYESKPTVELFATMRGNRYSMTVVLDEYGGTSGIITIEDLVEEIVGELTDEDDDSDDIEHITDGEYIIEGSTRIDDVNEMIGTTLESSNFDSIGGYVIENLGRFPDQGEEVVSEGIVFVVEEVDKNRIELIRVKIKDTKKTT